MAQPNKYEPSTFFARLQHYSRATTYDPVKIDVEFNNIKSSIAQIVDALAQLQRDDGRIADAALGEYKTRIQDEVSNAARHNARMDSRSEIDSYAPVVVKKAIDDYLKTLNLPNGGNTAPPNTTFDAIMRGYQLYDLLREANNAGDFVRLEEGEYFIPAPIRISKGNNENVKGIIGAGRGKTVIRFDWEQVVDWDANTNLTDARLEAGILVNGVGGKQFKDFSIKYEGRFYVERQSYFGSISCINIQNSSGNLVENVEAQGANRAGIFIGAASPALTQENRDVHQGKISVDAVKNHPVNNIVRNCWAHHNRVAGILIQNQISPRVLNNLCEYNGHERDGGTGYGICAFSNSVNVDVKIIGNTTRKNYRKGIDSHDAYDYEVRDNTSDGDRFFGCAIESRGFPMRKVIVENNRFIQDPDFRLALDDEHTDWTAHRNSDYYRYTAIRVENKSQASQAWRNPPAEVLISIKGNTVSGIKHDGRGIHRVIEFRNSENTANVRINGEISGNTISGQSVHNIFFGYGELPAYNGIGNFVIRNNIIDFDEILDVPFSVTEKNTAGMIHGVLEFSGNTVTARKNDAWVNVLNLECENRPLIKFNGNTINMPRATKQQIRLVSAAGASKQFVEVMNNIWNTASTAEQVKQLFIAKNTIPAGNINVYNNRVKNAQGDVITFDGAANNAESRDPSTTPPAPTSNLWEDRYTKPNVTVSAPVSPIVLNWAGATAETVSSSDGTSSIVKAGSNPPKDYGNLIDIAASPKFMRARLFGDKASAGVYPRLNMPKTASISTVVFPIKILTLGSSSRASTGLPIIGFGVTENSTDTVISGGVVAVKGTGENTFKFTKNLGVYVDGVPYQFEDLTFGKTYVITANGEKGASYINFGAAWNGNGQVSADIYGNFQVFPRSLSPAETAAVSVEIMKVVKPEALGGGSGGNTPPTTSTPDNGGSPTVTPAPNPATEKNAVFSMASAKVGDSMVAADSGSAVLISAKSIEARKDHADWSGMVVQKNSLKGARSLAPADNLSGRYIRIDNIAVGDEPSAVIFPFVVENTGAVGGAPLVITLNGNTPVSVGSAKLADDRLGWYAAPSNGFTVNGQVPKANVLLKFDTVYIGMIKQSKAFDSVRFGTNHVLNIWRNMMVLAGTEVCTGLSDSELNAKIDALKTRYNVGN